MNVITSKATAENTKNYLDALKDKIRVHGITSLQFRESNDFFFTDEKAGFIPCQLNKKHSGFEYRYQLPKQETDSDDFLSGKINLLNLKALKLQEFKGIDTQFASFAHIHKDYMLMLSQVSELSLIVIHFCCLKYLSDDFYQSSLIAYTLKALSFSTFHSC